VRRLQIGVAGSSDLHPFENAAQKARVFAQTLLSYKDEIVLITGGREGLMRIVSEEFSNGGGIVVGILPFEEEGNTYSTIRVKTGISSIMRSGTLIHSSDCIVILGGGAGTMIEALMAYNTGKPLVIISETGYRSDKLSLLLEDNYFDHKRLVKVFITTDPEEAAVKAVELARKHVKSITLSTD